jgi:hypothetical protein
MKPPKRLFRNRDLRPQTDPVPLEWPPVKHGQHVNFSDGIAGVVLMLEPGLCVIHREDGQTLCAQKEPDENVQFSWGAPQEPFVSVRDMVRMLYQFHTELGGENAGMAVHEVKEAIRRALDRQEFETTNADLDGRTEVMLSFAGIIRMAAARDGLDCRDLRQQESVFAEADKVLDKLASAE